MTSIAALIASAARRLRGEGSASLAKTFGTPTQHLTSRSAPNRLPAPSIRKHFILKTFVRSPLAAAALTAAEIDSIDAIYCHAGVQRAAGQLQLRRARLLELAGFRSSIAEAALAAGESGSVTPEQIAAALNRLADEADEEIAAAREDKATHDARHKSRMVRLQPLRVAVSTRLTALVAERDNLLISLDSIRRASTMSSPSAHRYHSLVAAGVTPEQISMLGIASADDQIAGIKARIAVLDAEIAPLREFGTSGDVVHLAGLGLDALVAQAHPEHAGEEVPA